MSFVDGSFKAGTSHWFQTGALCWVCDWTKLFHDWACAPEMCWFHGEWIGADGGDHTAGAGAATGAVPCNKALSQIGKPGHKAGLTPAGYRAGWSCWEWTTATITKKRTCKRVGKKCCHSLVTLHRFTAIYHNHYILDNNSAYPQNPCLT